MAERDVTTSSPCVSGVLPVKTYGVKPQGGMPQNHSKPPALSFPEVEGSEGTADGAFTGG